MYIDTTIVCFLIMLYAFFHLPTGKSGRPQDKFARILAAAGIDFSVIDYFVTYAGPTYFQGNELFAHITFFLYIDIGFILCYSLYRFSSHVLHKVPYWLKLILNMSLAIVSTYTVLCVAAIFVPDLLRPLDNLFLLVLSCADISLISITVVALMCFFDKKQFADKEQAGALLVNCAMLFFATVLQECFRTHACQTIGITLLVAHTYVMQNRPMVFRDELTGLDNRRRLLQDLQKRMGTGNTEWCLAMFDMNSFKKINDEFGHDEGDRALKMVADTLHTLSVTEEIHAYRYGGDEFVLLINKTYKDANALCIKLNEMLEMARLQRGRSYELTGSFGCVQYDPALHFSIPDFIGMADMLMYMMKQGKITKG